MIKRKHLMKDAGNIGRETLEDIIRKFGAPQAAYELEKNGRRRVLVYEYGKRVLMLFFFAYDRQTKTMVYSGSQGIRDKNIIRIFGKRKENPKLVRKMLNDMLKTNWKSLDFFPRGYLQRTCRTFSG